MKKTGRKMGLLILLAMMLCMFGTIVQAKDIWMQNGKVYRIDLNRDGKKEKLQIKDLSSKYDEDYLYFCIDGNELFPIYYGVLISDLNKKDKYQDIIRVGYNYETIIYHYQKRTLKQYARTVGSMSGSLTGGEGFMGEIKATHPNGNLDVDTWLLFENLRDGSYAGLQMFRLKYKVDHGRIVIDYSQTHNNTVSSPTSYDYFKAKKSWSVYKYPRKSSNKVLFKLKKGSKAFVKKLKITKDYIYAYVVERKTKKAGWIRLNGWEVKIGFMD